MKRFICTPVRALGAFVLAAVLFTGCDAFSPLGEGTAEGGAQFTLLLTDAPFPFDLVHSANVTIDSIEIVSSEDSVITLTSEPQSFNLLDLRDGVTAPLSTITLPEGTYSQIRLAVSEPSIVLKDELGEPGQTFDLKVPSGRIKVLVSGLTITDGMDTELTLDFDVSESFVVQGNPATPAGINGFIFKPTVKPINLESTPDDGDEIDDGTGDDGEVVTSEVEGTVTAVGTAAEDLFVSVDGTRYEVNEETVLTGFASLDALTTADRVRVVYVEVEGALVAREVELLPAESAQEGQ